jgi:nicotinamide-nucleotide amidase
VSAINQLVTELAQSLVARNFRLITAESCTGGMIASELTSLAGSSAWFEGAFVAYQLSAKQRMLGVPAALLERFGAVSEPTARAMAEGALKASDADISVAVTGVAGPDGGELTTPVGTVWFAWAMRGEDPLAPRCVQTSQHQLKGSRAQVREQAVVIALNGVMAVNAVSPTLP